MAPFQSLTGTSPTAPSQFIYNILLLCHLAASSRSLAIYQWHPLHTSLVHILMLSLLSLQSSHDLSLRFFWHKPLLSIKHKAYSLIFLAAVLSFFPKIPSVTSQIIFLKLSQPSSTLSNLKFSSLVFKCSWKVSLKFSSWSLPTI